MYDKTKRKELTSFIAIGILAFSLFSYFGGKIQVNVDTIQNEEQALIPKNAYFNLSASPITIVDSVAGMDWDWAKDQDWCTLKNGVYYIENLTINAQEGTYGISISNSNELFVIRNCTIFNATNLGIVLANTNNARIIGNNCSYIQEYETAAGIGIAGTSTNNTITGNNITHNSYGINIGQDSSNNTIYGNLINNNIVGINIFESDYNNISGNRIFLNSEAGIQLRPSTTSGRGNYFSGNNFTQDGFVIYPLTNTRASLLLNTFEETNLVNGKPLYYYANENGLDTNNFSTPGQIILVNSNESEIRDTIISDTTVPIYMLYCHNNIVRNNILVDNIKSGLEVHNSVNISISENNGSNNDQSGMYLCNLDDSRVLGNNSSSNTLHGMHVYYQSTYNNITTNNANLNGDSGISLENNCDDNLIKQNILFDNSKSGISVSGCSDNEINDNDAIYNDQNGISLVSGSISNELIRNNASYNTQNGISLKDSTHSTIMENNVSKNSLRGIYLDGSDDNDIISNKIHNNTLDGILINDGSDSNTIEDNDIFYNSQDGIGLNGTQYDCTYNTIDENSVHHNLFNGIANYECTNSIITENNVTYNTLNGIYLNESNSCNILQNDISYNEVSGVSINFNVDNSEITDNIVSNNSLYGILLNEGCNTNEIKGNKIENNDQIGVLIDNTCTGNTIFDNCFIGNTLHAQDNSSSSTANSWDNGTIGNYWDDWTSPDANEDNIVDEERVIDGSAGSKDTKPLVSCGARPPTPSGGAIGVPFIPGFDILTLMGVAVITFIIIKRKQFKK